MDSIKNRLAKIKRKANAIYRKPKIFVTINISGLIVSILGVMLCISIAGSAYYMNTTIHKQTTSAQTFIDNKLNTANDIVSLLGNAVDEIASTQVVSETISTVAGRNINRLNNFERTLNAINFHHFLNPTIDSVNDAKNNLQELQKNAEKLGTDGNKVKAFDKLQQRITKTQKRIDHSFRNIRVVTLIAFYSLLAVSVIFIVSCINLLSRTIQNLISHFKKPKK